MLLRFALLFPLLLFAFIQGAKLLNQSNCRSIALNTAIRKTLEGAVSKNSLALPLKFHLRCGFVIQKSAEGHRAIYIKRLQKMEVKFQLPSGIDYE